jgi:hypothetical protein
VNEPTIQRNLRALFHGELDELLDRPPGPGLPPLLEVLAKDALAGQRFGVRVVSIPPARQPSG